MLNIRYNNNGFPFGFTLDSKVSDDGTYIMTVNEAKIDTINI